LGNKSGSVFAVPTRRNVWDAAISDEYLVTQLEAKNVQVRFDAAVELGDRECQVAAKKLCTMLKKDYAYQARVGAAIALLEMNCTEAVPILKRAAEKDPNPVVRHVCAAAARQLVDKDV